MIQALLVFIVLLFFIFLGFPIFMATHTSYYRISGKTV